jgi:protein-ribulosamine 3-kinase
MSVAKKNFQLYGMPTMPLVVCSLIERNLSVKINGFHPASGGCINSGGELITSSGSYFIKWNDANRYPDMFQTEMKGLRLLASAKCISVPEVFGVYTDGGTQLIVMEFIQSSHRQKNFWTLLGEQLAALHKNSNTEYGLDHDNYIGSLPQRNSHKARWIDFFIEERLEFQLLLAEKNNRVEASLRRQFEALYKKLPELLPNENPSLLHGDLWSGNLMVNHKGEPALIDPAVYYGHREAELAFTQLFGGFKVEFYEAYHGTFPLFPGFRERVDIYNLYPLMVHTNLFGGGYLNQVKGIFHQVL